MVYLFLPSLSHTVFSDKLGVVPPAFGRVVVHNVAPAMSAGDWSMCLIFEVAQVLVQLACFGSEDRNFADVLEQFFMICSCLLAQEFCLIQQPVVFLLDVSLDASCMRRFIVRA